MPDQMQLYDDQDMRNGTGDPSHTLVLAIPGVEKPEEQIVALQAVELSFLQNMVAQSSVPIFVHVPQYHWHTSGTGGIDQ